MDYKTKAVNCLKNTALPVLLQRFRECGSDLDAYCAQYGETEFFFARVVQRGHVYDMRWVIQGACAPKRRWGGKRPPFASAPDRGCCIF